MIWFVIGLAAGYAFRWKQDAVIAFVDEKVKTWFKRS